MPATPRRKLTSEQTQSPAQSLVGRAVAIPSDVFKESDSQYTGRVVGTPRRKNAVYVKVDQDDTEYWFPADEVAKWVVDKPEPAAAVKTPKVRKQAQRTDSPQGVSKTASSHPTQVPGRRTRQAVQSSIEHQETNLQEAQQLQDAASFHPENSDAFADTIEELAATSADQIKAASHSSTSCTWLLVVFVVLLAVLAAAAIRADVTGFYMQHMTHLQRHRRL